MGEGTAKRPRGRRGDVASESGDGEGRGGRLLPWSRSLLALAVAGPALWLGGVKPWIVPVFAVVVFGMLLRRCLRRDQPLRVPALWWVGLVAAGVTALQWIPLPGPVLELLAPRLQAAVGEALVGTDLRWRRLSVHPGQTGLEVARLLALTGLFIAAAQLSWRLVATYVSATGTAVAVIGLVHKLAGAEAIYGVYVPRQAIYGLGQELGSPLLTSFVNANHQSGLLLLGVFAAAGIASDLRVRASEALDHRSADRLSDRAVLAIGALAIQATALVLSMSRGALLAAVIVAPLAFWVVGRGQAGGRLGLSGGRDGRHARARQLGLAALAVVMLGLAVTQGAWDQLATLTDASSFANKARVAREGLGLVAWSPVLGTGRGTFVDLFVLVDSEPGPIVFTHLESTPLAFVVEWGPVIGGGLVVALALWWVRSFSANPSVQRRLVLCGLLALAVQSLADFSLEFLGVAAPAVALAGSLGVSAGRGRLRGRSREPGKPMAVRGTLIAASVGLIAAEAIAIASLPHSWSPRRARDQALLDGARYDAAAAEAALAKTPLDPFVHLAIARADLRAGAAESALVRAEVAARLRPASVDTNLTAAVAAFAVDRPLLGVDYVRAALARVRRPVPEELIAFLTAAIPEPRQLAALAPEEPEAWSALTWALVEPAPAYARALAVARARSHPEEAEPLRVQTRLALARDNPGLALHHARMWVALQPERAEAHRMRAQARLALRERDRDELGTAIAELEAALEAGVDDPASVEEFLVRCLLIQGDRRALDRADAILEDLLARRAEPADHRRRSALAERVRDRRE